MTDTAMPAQSKNACRCTLVCVDAYEQQILAGRLFNVEQGQEQPFIGLMQLFKNIEAQLDQAQFPQSFTDLRSFWSDHAAPEPAAPSGNHTFCEPRGALATFAVKVMFRQNACWQGAVTWLEHGREQGFRSVLELSLLIDSALVSR